MKMDSRQSKERTRGQMKVQVDIVRITAVQTLTVGLLFWYLGKVQGSTMYSSHSWQTTALQQSIRNAWLIRCTVKKGGNESVVRCLTANLHSQPTEVVLVFKNHKTYNWIPRANTSCAHLLGIYEYVTSYKVVPLIVLW